MWNSSLSEVVVAGESFRFLFLSTNHSPQSCAIGDMNARACRTTRCSLPCKRHFCTASSGGARGRRNVQDKPCVDVVKRKYCRQDGCDNRVVQGGVCVQHGAIVKRKERGGSKHKYCNQEGCGNTVQQGGVCIKHGARVKLCNKEGCVNKVVQGGFCKQHGAVKRRS